jgi:hypothetical protein
MFFPEVGHRMPFGIHVYKGSSGEIDFKAIFNIFRPETINSCLSGGNLSDPLPELKTEDGEWQFQGHPDRLVHITLKTLDVLKRIFEEERTPHEHSRLPKIHGRQILSVLEKVGASNTRLGSLTGLYTPTEMFHESNAQRNGIITRSERPTHIPVSADDLVLSGPLIHIATPWSKQARTVCRQKSDYDDIPIGLKQVAQLLREGGGHGRHRPA